MRELSLSNSRLDKRYDVRGELGRGSYAEVFLAKDTLASEHSPHVLVVIKALNVFLQDDLDPDLERTLVENFENEAVALDRVRHPNIISRLGHGTAKDLNGTVFHYLVLEYLPGGNLQSRVREGRLSLDEMLEYVEQICAGLSYAHSYGIIHRDIKPQNLLLSRDGKTVKIADFGVARISSADSPITRVGTNIYAPPEHSPLSAGQTGKLGGLQLTPSADIYSLAKTVYTLISGESPRAFVNEQITSLPASVSGFAWSEALLATLRKATSPHPSERFGTVAEFWTDLASLRNPMETETVWRKDRIQMPQPHVSRGYTPLAPERPSFGAIPDLPLVHMYGDKAERAEVSESQRSVGKTISIPENSANAAEKRRLRRVRSRWIRTAVVLLSLGVFTGLLFGTASYMRGKSFLPSITNPFKTRTAVANTDIYLRPSPSTDNDPIGLVTKNSKVRIVNTQNSWYQVDIVEQGRVRNAAQNTTASRGWLNGKYLDLDSN